MVSPAGPVIPSTSGGLLGHGCVGDQRILARRCTACPSISRRWFPSGADEAMAAAAWWNKSLQLLHRLGDVFSGVGEELVRVRSTGLRCFTVVELSSRAGPSLGVCLALHPGMDWASILLCSRTVVGFVERWWTDPFCSSGEGWIHGHRSWGCVPGRCTFVVFFYCGSSQSLWAIQLLLARELLSFSPVSGDVVHGGERQRRRPWKTSCAKDLKDFDVIFLFVRVFCAKRLGHLSYCNFPEGACNVPSLCLLSLI